MAKEQNPIFKKLGIEKGRDPLVNENPTLSPEDEITYLKEYLRDGKRRLEEAIATNTKYREQIELLDQKPETLPSTREYQIFKEMLNGIASAGEFDMANLAKKGGTKYLHALFDHLAGVAEVAASRVKSRF